MSDFLITRKHGKITINAAKSSSLVHIGTYLRMYMYRLLVSNVPIGKHGVVGDQKFPGSSVDAHFLFK